MKILCKFGIHDWKIFAGVKNSWEERHCIRCPKMQYQDFYGSVNGWVDITESRVPVIETVVSVAPAVEHLDLVPILEAAAKEKNPVSGHVALVEFNNNTMEQIPMPIIRTTSGGSSGAGPGSPSYDNRGAGGAGAVTRHYIVKDGIYYPAGRDNYTPNGFKIK